MSIHEETSARLKGPVAAAGGSASTVEGPFAESIGTTHVVFTIPTAWKNRRVDVTVKNHASSTTANTVWLAFGTSASMEVDRAATVTGTPPAWTGSATIGRPIRDGETRDYYIDPTWTHFAVESDENTNQPIIYIHLSDYHHSRR